ncbi:hypothetical protein DL96DRAFT_1582932 [Flagelloscypha sp. PMI_526]|nr:hypothetical protein DL96DRAFT_1582932 [Flagelloscypha sp. PMI_526]
MHRVPRLQRRLPHFAPSNTRQLFTGARPPPRNPLVTTLYVTATTVGAGLFAFYYFDARSAIHRYFLTPSIRYLFDAETGQKIAVKVLKSGFGPRDPVGDDERLQSELWGQKLSNPIGLAAGFDKNGEAIDGLFNLGFSWVEIGSVTPHPQEGNAKPRMFHLPDDDAIINRYGFPSLGFTYVFSRLTARIPKYTAATSDRASQKDDAFLAVNLGKDKTSPLESVEDYISGVSKFGPRLRDLQNRRHLELLLSGVTKARDQLPVTQRPKLVLKVAPDLTEAQIVEMSSVIRAAKIDGVIVSNTTVQRPAALTHANKTEAGGLSGRPLKPISLAALKTFRKNLPSSIPLIGAGGISTASDALDFAEAGASIVQIYTSFGYDGPGAPRRLKDDLILLLTQRGATWKEVSQQAVEKLSWKPSDNPVPGLIAEAKHIARLLEELEDRIVKEST